MLTKKHHFYLDKILRTKPTVVPIEAPYPLNDGHQPKHQECQITAMHLETTMGWRAQIGIQWLDRQGLLCPWPHVTNWRDAKLFDFSKPIKEDKLGFTLIGNDVDMANSITSALNLIEKSKANSYHTDPFLQKLHSDWYFKLKEITSPDPDKT